MDYALNLPDSEAQFVNLVKQLKIEGWNQLEVYELFTNYRNLLDSDNREFESDIVGDVLDLIYGWCGESAKLFGRTMSNDEIFQYRESKKQ